MYLTLTHTYTSRMYYGRKRGFKPVSVYSEEDMDTFHGEGKHGFKPVNVYSGEDMDTFCGEGKVGSNQ